MTTEIQRTKNAICMLVDVTYHLRTAVINGDRLHIQELSRKMAVSEKFLIAFIEDLFDTGYADEQFLMLVSQLSHTFWPASMNTSTKKVNLTVSLPPAEIIAKFLEVPAENIVAAMNLSDGTDRLKQHWAGSWDRKVLEWRDSLLTDMETSGVVRRLQARFPYVPPEERSLDQLLERIVEQGLMSPELRAAVEEHRG